MTALGENTYLSSVRAGMVSAAAPTIIGSVFVIVAFFPIGAWDHIIAPYRELLQVPITVTFGILSVYICFGCAYDLGKQFKQEAITSASMAILVFILIQINPKTSTISMDNLGSNGIFSSLVVAFVTVWTQRYFSQRNWVIKLPKNVPPIVYESFVSLSPLLFLILVFWIIRFVLVIDINNLIQQIFKPLIFALNTLPGILVYASLVILLWSVGINGDNVMDAFVGPILLQYLVENTTAMIHGQPIPYITAVGFFSTFVTVGGSGATIALSILMFNSRDSGYRKISRMAMPAQVFNINEPIFFGFPIVMNPVFMVPYILVTLVLTVCSYLLMYFNFISRPVINIPWTTPPIISHYLITGGDWRACIWGIISIFIAIAIYYPFAKVAEAQRIKAETKGCVHI